MSLIPWRKHNPPAQRASSLQSDLNRFFDDVFQGWHTMAVPESRWAPALSVKENKKKITVTAEVPGMDPEDLELNIEDRVLTLRGEKRHEHKDEDGDTVRSEIYFGSFMRQVLLPCEVDTERAEASVKKGVLTLQLPKTATARTKSIKVK